MVETPHVQWKIAKIGEKQRRAAKISTSLYYIDVAEFISSDRSMTKNKINLMHLLCMRRHYCNVWKRQHWTDSQFAYGLFTPPTRTRQNCLVLSCRRCAQTIKRYLVSLVFVRIVIDAHYCYRISVCLSVCHTVDPRPNAQYFTIRCAPLSRMISLVFWGRILQSTAQWFIPKEGVK